MKKSIITSVISILIILSGCNSSEKFTEVIEGNVEKIVVESEVAVPGKEVTYSTNNKEIIRDFLDMMDSMPFEKTNRSSSVFEETYKLYNKDNELIETVIFVGENIAIMNGDQYEIDGEKLGDFTEQFYVNKNVLKKN
ncbi:hypothetical protein [Alkalihalobacillus sp. AL-G]|uniref:hypothetical protein n=1 Tax=Alkalihalobacillus sp. AL-G TaxID=2926399 RepID=UPI00272D43EF|nr:hypothetical protein [Alkalihalobacillus sp. AL-G]WLD94188.1 hypothetical protein MOJ78_04660 [Alkalihalobacillus sp. AL-G]